MNPEHMIPLAERMRPKAWKNLWGRAISSEAESLSLPLLIKKQAVSMLFWGDPGTGKTTRTIFR